MTGDQLPDLVTAIHHDPTHFDPNASEWFGAWPSCTPDAACPALSSTCMDEVIDCSSEPDKSCQVLGDVVDACVDAAPRIACDVMMKSAPPVYEVCDCAGNSACTEVCAYENQINPPVNGSFDCSAKSPHMRCDRYPWMIYENRGGYLASQPAVKYQPIPLESDTGDSAFGGGGVSSTHHAVQDIDGDGNVDAVLLGRYAEGVVDIPYSAHWWLVFPGDGNGNFLTSASGAPYIWTGPKRAPVAGGCVSGPGEGCSVLAVQPAWRPEHDVKGLSALIDLNGDGPADLVWKLAPNQFVPDPARPWVPWRAVFEDDPIQFFKGSGRGFEYQGSMQQPNGTPLAWGGLAYFARSSVIGAEYNGNFITHGLRRSKARFVDLDTDGRPDVLESGWSSVAGWDNSTSLFINGGGMMLPPLALSAGDTELLGQETVAAPSGYATPREWGWYSTKDMLDLDGDGLPEVWSFDGAAVEVHGDADRQPMRLLKRINNGRGATTEVSYAPHTDTSVVTQTITSGTGPRKAMPRTTWVVKEIVTRDVWESELDISTTKYTYKNPVWREDDEQRWGFRGFEEVTTTAPSGAWTVDTYGYDVDWSGRLTMTRAYSTEDLAGPRTITEQTWYQYTLFGGTIKTFHPTWTKKWTCRNGQTEAQCRSANSGLTYFLQSWVAIAANSTGSGTTNLLYFLQQTRTQEGLYFDSGDRRTWDTHYLYADEDDYRLQVYIHAALEATSAVRADDRWTTYEWWVHDPTYRVPLEHHRLFAWEEGSWAKRAITKSEFDMATGLVRTTRAPRNELTGQVESYKYDSTGRFVTTTTNELGHAVDRSYEPGTGAVLTVRGPGAYSCGASCVNYQQSWTDVDGLGRPTAGWVNVEVAGNPSWQKTQTSRTVYTDSVIGDARTKVVSESLIDYGGNRWTREETQLDGRGRPVRVAVRTGGAVDAVTTRDYDHRGHVVAVSLPDPSQDSAATVTYTYGYDSLGRPTSMRRPAVGGTAASGIDLSYDGPVHVRTEVAGAQGGPAAKTMLVHDPLGRLSEVHEFTDVAAGTVAITRYAYDAGDRVRRIENPDGVVTELTHDFAGRRIRIVRGGRTWSYDYNKSGEMTSEAAPAPSPELAAAYTTTFAYDPVGRPTSRAVAPRSVDAADRALLGIGTIVFSNDTCTNGTGRLCSVTHPNSTLSTTFSYDAEGNTTGESREFGFGGVVGEMATSATYGPGGKLVSRTYADHPVEPTQALFEYDDRGAPRLAGR